MPYIQQYSEAPRDMSIPVSKDLPAEYEERESLLTPFREAETKLQFWGQGLPHTAYFCGNCGGWIMGEPNKYHVNTLNPAQLAGRQGEEYYCRRCGNIIGFMGIMS